jgi:hypothetical protein
VKLLVKRLLLVEQPKSYVMRREKGCSGSGGVFRR